MGSGNIRTLDLLRDFLVGLIDDPDWTVAVLEFRIQPGSLKMTGFSEGNLGKRWLRTRFGQELKASLKEFHTVTTPNGDDKWNLMLFKTTPDGKYDIEYFWDIEWQNRVDFYNMEALERNPNYKMPKWHWEE